MKKFKLFLLCIFALEFLFSISSLAQRANFWEPTGVLPNKDIWSLALNSSGHIFAGTAFGIYKSTNNGDTWVLASSDLTDQLIGALAIKSNGTMLAGSSTGGIYRSTNNGVNWQQVQAGVDVRSLVVGSDGKIYAGIWQGYVYISSDDGLTWQQSKNGMGNSLVRPVLITSSKIYAGTSGTGVYNTSDGGANWNPANTYADQNVVCLASKGTNIFAGTAGNGIFKSTDQGLNWTQVNNGLTETRDLFLRSIILSPDGKLYAGTFYSGVFRSTDDGNSWYKISSGLTNWNVLSIIVRPDGRIFCGTNGSGVFRNVIQTKPVFFVDKDTIIFTAPRRGLTVPGSHLLNISNIGIGTFNWNIASKPSWLNLSMMSGTDVGVITATVNNTDFPGGEKQEYIIYNSTPGTENNPDTTLVILRINAPVIEVTPPDSLWFDKVNQNAIKTLPLLIKNIGNISLSVTALTVTGGDAALFTKQNNPNSFNLAPGETYTLNMQFRPTSIGYKYSNIVITHNADGSPTTVKMSGIGVGPTIKVDKDTLIFTAVKGDVLPDDQLFEISNGGGGTLNWSASKDQNWLDVSTTPGMQTETRSVHINTTNMNPGTWTANVLISSPEALNSPKLVIVLYTVIQGPKLTVNPTTLSFATLQNTTPPPASKTFTISNTGGGKLNWTLSIKNNADWMSLTTPSGQMTGLINTKDSISITVNIIKTDKPLGQYADTILVTAAGAENSPQMVVVNYNITQAPKIELTPDTLSFTAYQNDPAMPPNQTFRVSNVGGGALGWFPDIFNKPAWIDIINNTIDSTVTVKILKTNLPINIYTDSVVVTSIQATNSPQRVIIIYTVKQKSGLSISPRSLLFEAIMDSSAIPASAQLNLVKSGNESTKWSVIKNPSWLSLDKNSDTGNAVIKISNIKTNYVMGEYKESIIFEIKGTETIYDTIPVTLKIYERILKVDRNILDFGDVALGSSEDRFETISNEGNIPLKISSLQIKDGDAIHFLKPNGEDTITINPGKSIQLFIKFRPSSEGNKTSNLYISFNGPGSPSIVKLVGNCIKTNALINPKLLEFTYVQGAIVSDFKYIYIKKTGIGTLKWRITEYPSGWLYTDKIDGEADDSVKIKVNNTYLPPGYQKSIIVLKLDAAETTYDTVRISLLILLPVLSVNPSPMDFGQCPINANTDKDLTISNTGNMPLEIKSFQISGQDFSLPNGGNKLTIDTGKSSTLKIRFNPSSIGPKNGTLTITYSNGIKDITTDVLLRGTGVTTSLDVSPDNLSFTAFRGGNTNPSSGQLKVSKTGQSAISWKITSKPDWIDVKPSELNDTTTIEVKVNKTSFTMGDQVGDIVFQLNSTETTNKTIKVKLTIYERILKADPSPVDFGNKTVNESVTKNVTLTNMGNSQISISSITISGNDASMFNILNKPPTLTLDPGQSYSLSLMFSPASAGDKISNLVLIYNTGTIDTSFTVKLNGRGLAGPTLEVKPDTLKFDAIRYDSVKNIQPQYFKIRNIGNLEKLNWSVDMSGSKAWFNVDKSGGLGDDSVRVNINLTNLAPGFNIGWVIIKTTASTIVSNSPDTVFISYTVLPGPKLQVSTSSIIFNTTPNGPKPNSQKFSVSNNGNGRMYWKLNIKNNSLWLDVGQKYQGYDTGTVTLSILNTNFPSGSYSDIVEVRADSADNSPQNVNVTLNIISRPIVNIGIPKNYSAKPGEKLTIPVQVTTDLAGKSARNYTMLLSYKKRLLNAEKVSATGTMLSGATPTMNTVHGVYYDSLYITYPGSSDLTGTGNLIQVDFTALLGDTCDTPVKVEYVNFNIEGPSAAYDPEKRFALIGRCNGAYLKSTTVTSLSQNTPNPMVSGSGTTIQYSIATPGNVKLKVYDVLGKEVAGLVDEFKSEGTYQVRFSGKNLPTGLYFYRLQSGTIDEIKKLIVIK